MSENGLSREMKSALDRLEKAESALWRANSRLGFGDEPIPEDRAEMSKRIEEHREARKEVDAARKALDEQRMKEAKQLASEDGS